MFLVLMQGIGGINWPTIGLEYWLMILWFTFYSLHCDYFLWCSNNGFIPLASVQLRDHTRHHVLRLKTQPLRKIANK
jgi:hypothetical protein